MAAEEPSDSPRPVALEYELFWPHIEAINSLHTFVELALQGMHEGIHASEYPDLLRRLAKFDPNYKHYLDEDVYQAFKSRGKTLEQFAKAEAERGFPYLLGLACVRLVTILETAIETILLQCIIKLPLPKDRNPLTRLQGPLLPFMGMSEDERAAFLLDLLTRETRAQFQPGVGRFETLLQAVGLDGEVNQLVGRLLLELIETRNVVVHEGGVADPRFISRCPWVGAAQDEELRIQHLKFDLFSRAAMWYLIELHRRWTVSRISLIEDPSHYVAPSEIQMLRDETGQHLEELLARWERSQNTSSSAI